MERIHKVIAASGLTSRRKAEDLVAAGKVTVNGVPATAGQAVSETDSIKVEGKPLPKAVSTTYVLNKPVNTVCSTKRQKGEKLVTDLIPAHPPVYPVGRLDKDSGGLLLLTNDGDLAQRLTHPSFMHKKVYRVVATWKDDAKDKDPEAAKRKLLAGVKLGDGKAAADAVTILSSKDGGFAMDIRVHEGRNHLIRRMCATVGLAVESLVRIQLGGLLLDGLPIGGYRVLSKRERSLLLH